MTSRESEHAKRVRASQAPPEEPETPEGRTEEDKIFQTPITVILGGEEVWIKPLPMALSREWRKKAAPFRAELIAIQAVNTDDPVAFEQAFRSLMLERLDEAIDIFFAYAKDLARDEIEAVADDQEFGKAWEKVCEYAFPLGM